jgi:hypothetical protein
MERRRADQILQNVGRAPQIRHGTICFALTIINRFN